LEEKNTFLIIRSLSSQIPDTKQQPVNPSRFKRFGKKPLAAIIALISILIIVGAFFIPQSGATIPLTADYAIGEKMVYDNTITMTVNSYQLGSL